MNDIFNDVLEAVANGGPKTYMVYDEVHKRLTNNTQYKEADEKFHDALREKQFTENRLNKVKQYATAELTYSYPNFADMCSGATNNSFGYGHSRSYWKDDETNQVNEFFAEMSAIKATGNDKELEMIKKFLPESVKKYEEVIDNILRNKGAALDL